MLTPRSRPSKQRGGRGHVALGDLRSAADARTLADQACDLAGGVVHILVNNAGVYPFGPTAATGEDQFDRAFDVNVTVPFFLVAALAPRMAARGSGSIVNVTSMVADFGVRFMALYGSTKAALTLLTKAWAAEYGPQGVRVNAVSPGPTRTEGTDAMGGNRDAMVAGTPAGRPATADEIAVGITFLAVGPSAFLHGAVIPIDGVRTSVQTLM